MNEAGCALLLVLGAVLGMALLNWRAADDGYRHFARRRAVTPQTPRFSPHADWLPGDAGTAEAVTYPEMLARPLFRSSRRPAEAVKPQIAAEESVPPPEPACEIARRHPTCRDHEGNRRDRARADPVRGFAHGTMG